MGCLKKILNCLLLLGFIYIFFAFGGYTFLKDKYDSYTSPTRSVFVEEEKDFGNLEDVGADFVLSRSLNFFGYRKLNAYYTPKRQRITILDLNSDKILSEDDFQNGKLKEKLEKLTGRFIHSPIMPISNIKITKTGKIKADKKIIPYANFEADVKMVPLFKAKGTVAIYQTKNRKHIIKGSSVSPKMVISAKFPTGYDDRITKKFISELKF